MIFGIGIDICLIDNFRHFITFNSFLRKVFNPDEISKDCGEKYLFQMAIIFSIKESVSKAIGTGFNGILMPKLIHVLHEDGHYKVEFYDKAKDFIEGLNISDIIVNVIRENGYVLTLVIIEKD